jgi:hypothetical protein
MLGVSFISVLESFGKGTSHLPASQISTLQYCKYSNTENYYALGLIKLPSFKYCFFILQFTFGMLDLLDFSEISFGSGMDMKRLSHNLMSL